jgi:5-methylcytosine-specific restriction endonuclease McrA
MIHENNNPMRPTLDHYIPLCSVEELRNNGYVIENNVVPACWTCNNNKGSKLPKDWRNRVLKK